MAFVPVTEEEAFAAALAACGAHAESYLADKLRESPGEFFMCGSSIVPDAGTPAFTDVCTYFAVRGGAVVMRDKE